MNVKEESEKPGLKSLIQNTKIMTLSPVTSWQIDGKTTESVTGFLFLASSITADGDCSHEIKSCLLLGRKTDRPRQHIKKRTHMYTCGGFILIFGKTNTIM